MSSPKSRIEKTISIAVALLLWQAAAMAMDQPLLLVSPLQVLLRLTELVREPAFFSTLFNSLLRIWLGFTLGFVIAVLLAIPAARFRWVEILLWPYTMTIKSIPVTSFIILALIWLGVDKLSVFISFLIVFPVIYASVVNGIRATDPSLLEMAGLFKVPFRRQLLCIYLPALRPHLTGACATAMGLAWKAGVAAEVIGIPVHTIGEKLYEAKIYLSSADLFAWTFCIVLLAVLSEKALLALISRALERGGIA